MSKGAPLAHEAFRQRQKTADLDGLSYRPLRVAWTDLGDGEPVILLHGIMGSSLSWFQNIPPLAERHRVIALDFPGLGKSEGEKVGIEEYTRALRRFIDDWIAPRWRVTA